MNDNDQHVNNGRITNGEKRLQWVPIAKMRISPRAQRSHDKPGSRARSEHIANNFDPDKCTPMILSARDGLFWLIDGGHRYGAFILMGWEDQQIQCWVYHGLTEKQEADMFLDLNNVRLVSAMEKFKVAVVAGRGKECDIDRIVRSEKLAVGTGSDDIGCVSALTKTYERGAGVLGTTVRVTRESFGILGFKARIVEGLGLFVANYENNFEENRLVERLSHTAGGLGALLTESEVMKDRYGVSGAVGVAAATVKTYNHGRGGPKLNGWWSTFNPKGDDES